jgi:catechol 2,3-dioxygenase-like lactoylglutathione lyase family enzyme
MQGMSAIARLGAVSLDAADPGPLVRFYQELLGLEVYFDSPDFVALSGASVLLTVQRVEGNPPVDWPTGPVPKQIHLELSVDDLDVAEKAAIELGATKANVQPKPAVFRVLIDPAGHPFCLSNAIPKPETQ